MSGPRILVVRLGAMGDVIHTLPAIASLKHAMPHSRIVWVIEARWAPLLEGNSDLDQVIEVSGYGLADLHHLWKALRSERFDCVADFQGLTKSALIASCAKAERVIGFQDSRERPAAFFYSSTVHTSAVHMVDQNLDLGAALGASKFLRSFPIPSGRPEGTLPEGDFVLASPFAGWGAKQWPFEYYSELGRKLYREAGLRLVLNAPRPVGIENTYLHVSGLRGLIWATRKAVAVLGLDSGPLHLAAALGKPGVAIYGPTDPARNGPYQSAIKVLRAAGAETTHRRDAQPAASMRQIRVETVLEALKAVLRTAAAARALEAGNAQRVHERL